MYAAAEVVQDIACLGYGALPGAIRCDREARLAEVRKLLKQQLGLKILELCEDTEFSFVRSAERGRAASASTPY